MQNHIYTDTNHIRRLRRRRDRRSLRRNIFDVERKRFDRLIFDYEEEIPLYSYSISTVSKRPRCPNGDLLTKVMSFASVFKRRARRKPFRTAVICLCLLALCIGYRTTIRRPASPTSWQVYDDDGILRGWDAAEEKTIHPVEVLIERGLARWKSLLARYLASKLFMADIQTVDYSRRCRVRIPPAIRTRFTSGF